MTGERSRSDREVLEELCYEYPPKLRKIEKILEQIEDFHDFYNEINEDYVIFSEDFLGTFIREYFVRINEDWFGKYVYNRKEQKRLIKSYLNISMIQYKGNDQK